MKFLIGGGLNTALTYCIYLMLSQLINYQIAYAIAYAAGIVFAYFFNSKMVFKVGHSWLGMVIYPSIYIVQYVISALLLKFLAERMQIDTAIAPIIVIVLLLPCSYLLNKFVLKLTHKTIPSQD
ncbi:polysaccharide synthesis protein GtrA [Pseudomonas moraviensis]|uniref:Polysaccharide synthesis protein GtrA n=1 Tax=Pseudomonas moraviensis TaxID=321662 RepID=A0A423NQ96_9PSED|nr:polysaccharide synthesis protein GtrA [Pseudomonas moraviensis]